MENELRVMNEINDHERKRTEDGNGNHPRRAGERATGMAIRNEKNGVNRRVRINLCEIE